MTRSGSHSGHTIHAKGRPWEAYLNQLDAPVVVFPDGTCCGLVSTVLRDNNRELDGAGSVLEQKVQATSGVFSRGKGMESTSV
jgi:hypothetical protein